MTEDTQSGLVGIRPVERSRRNLFRLVLLAAAVVLPLVLQDFQLALTIEIILLAMYAMSADFLIGYTGYVTFGHAVFYGVAAYTTANVLLHVTDIAPVAILAGIGAVVLIGVPIGYFSLKRHGIYFAMLTLAFSQIFFVLAEDDIYGLTGGSNGLTGLPRGDFGIPGIVPFVPTQMGYYYLLLLVFVVFYLVLRRIVHSPFGAVMKAIRENEERAEYAGYDTDRYMLVTFTISGAFGGIAGALAAPYFQVVSTEILFWTFSGEAVVLVIVGGLGTLVGSVLGAILFVGLRELVSPLLRDWQIVLGLLFIVFILYLPNGMISAWDVLKARVDDLRGD